MSLGKQAGLRQPLGLSAVERVETCGPLGAVRITKGKSERLVSPRTAPSALQNYEAFLSGVKRCAVGVRERLDQAWSSYKDRRCDSPMARTHPVDTSLHEASRIIVADLPEDLT